MGWWSTDILGGDSPLDAIYDYERHVELSKDESIYPLEKMTPAIENKIKEVFNKNPMAWLQIAKNDNYEQDVVAEVGAVILMAVGADLPEKYKTEVIKMIEQDEWAMENQERKGKIDNLITAIKGYKKGIPTVIANKGLFEVIFEGEG